MAWQKSNTGMYHCGYCNGAMRNRPLFLSGPKLEFDQIPKDAKVCKKCRGVA